MAVKDTPEAKPEVIEGKPVKLDTAPLGDQAPAAPLPPGVTIEKLVDIPPDAITAMSIEEANRLLSLPPPQPLELMEPEARQGYFILRRRLSLRAQQLPDDTQPSAANKRCC